MKRSSIVLALPLCCVLIIAPLSHAQSVESSGSNGSVSTNDLAVPELVPPAPGSITNPANQASITQVSSLNVADITQSGLGNYAVIIQAGNSASVAVINQRGDHGRAVIRQN
jgi:hypothetical protein